MSTYAVQQVAVLPGWLAQPQAAAWFRALGGLKDGQVDRIRQGQNERYAQVASPDGVLNLSGNMGIDAGYSETAAQLRPRLSTAFATWQRAGSAWGLLEQLVAQGYANVSVATQAGIFYSTPVNPVTGPVVTVTGGTLSFAPMGFWNTFAVIFSPPPGTWTSIATPLTSSTSPSIDEVNRIRTTINNRRPGHAKCASIIAFTSGQLWDYPTELWGSVPFTWTNTPAVSTSWSAVIGSTT